MSQPIKRVLISQPKPISDNSSYYTLAQKLDLEIDFKQFIQVVTLPATEFRKQKISIPAFSSVIFTSRTSITHFFELTEEMRLTMSQEVRYFCLTEAVALYLQKFITYRKRRVSYGTDGTLEGLLPALQKHETENFLLPVAQEHSSELADLLKKEKLNFREAVVYRTVSRIFPKTESLIDYDAIVFFSPQGVTSLFDNCPDFEQGDRRIIASGPQTAKAIEQAGLRLDCMLSAPGRPKSITESLGKFIEEQA